MFIVPRVRAVNYALEATHYDDNVDERWSIRVSILVWLAASLIGWSALFSLTNPVFS